MGTLDNEFERDWLIGLGTKLGDGHSYFVFFFSVSGIFSGKADSVMLLAVKCTINP